MKDSKDVITNEITTKMHPIKRIRQNRTAEGILVKILIAKLLCSVARETNQKIEKKNSAKFTI